MHIILHTRQSTVVDVQVRTSQLLVKCVKFFSTYPTGESYFFSGIVSNADYLDRETLDHYSLKIKVTDQDSSRVRNNIVLWKQLTITYIGNQLHH